MAYYDPITGEYMEGEDPNAPARPPSPMQAIAEQTLDPKQAWVQGGTTGDVNRDSILRYFARGSMELAAKLNRDPAEIVDTAIDKVGPGKMFLANVLQGIGASLHGEPFKTVRQSLFERVMEERKLWLQQQQNDTLRLQQLLQMESREGIAANREKGLDNRFSAGLEFKNDQLRQQYEIFSEQLEQKKIQDQRMYEAENARIDLIEDDLERKKTRDANDKAHQERMDANAKEANRIRKAAGVSTLYDGKTSDSSAIVNFGKHATTTAGVRRKDLETFTVDMARQWDEAQLMPEGPEKEAKLQATTRAMRGKINQLVLDDLPAAQRDAHDYRSDTLSMITKARNILYDIMDKGGGTGPITGKLQDFQARYTGKADPEFLRLRTMLRENFLRFRNVLSGVAFGDNETIDYESIRALADKPEETNLVLLDEMERAAVEATVREINSVDSNALRFFVKENPEGGPVISIDGNIYDSKYLPWVTDIVKRYGL